jgi:tetratricopeptide (TPR) repeat protein
MDIASNFIIGTLSSGLSDKLSNFMDKKHIEKLMVKLRETVSTETISHHQNELYYNDLDGYITKNSIVDILIRICYNKNDSGFLTVESFSVLHADNFIESCNCHLGQRGIIKNIFRRMYNVIDSTINNCNFNEETRIITNKIESSSEKLTKEIKEGFQFLHDEIKNSSRSVSVLSENFKSSVAPNLAIHALAQENVNLQNAIHEISTATENLIDQKYNEVLDIALNGSWFNANKILVETIKKTSGSGGKSRAKLLYLAARWTLPHDKDIAASYYEESMKSDPEQDTRLYHASLFELSEDYNAAINALGDIDSTVIFNQYLMLMFNSRTFIDIELAIKEYEQLKFNEGTHHAILLHSLRYADFSRAIDCAEKLIKLREHSALYFHLAGMVFYWKAIARNTPHEPGTLFAVPMSSERNLSLLEIEDANKASECFQKAYEIAKSNSDEAMLTSVLMGIVSVDWILHKSEIAEAKAKELMQIDKGNPVAALCLFEYDRIEYVCISTLEERAYKDPCAASVYIKHLSKIGEYESAVSAIEKFEEQIKSISLFEWVDLNIWVSIKSKDISRAYTVLELHQEDLQPDEHMRSLLYVMQFDESKKPSDIIGQATKIKDQYSHSMDYKNLCNVYRRFRKWAKVARIAKQWMKKYQTTEALFYVAEAQYNMKKIPDCLENLSKIESEYGLAVSQKILKLNCLSQLSRFDEALALVDEIGNIVYANEALIVHKAKLEFSNGSFDEAVRTLRLFIDSNDDAVESVLFLAKLLSVDYPKEAYRELKNLHEKHPERIDIALNTMQQGFASGYDEEASQIMWKITRSRPNKKHFKTLKSDEIIPFFQKVVKSNEPMHDMYRNGMLPNHAMFDKLNGSMGFYVYSKWILSNNTHMFWSYGGRTECNLGSAFEDKKLVLDYSAILTIECLGLFDVVEKLFDKIYVSPRLTFNLHHEIGRLKNIQESVKKNNEMLYRHFQNRKQCIAIVENCLDCESLIDVEHQDKVLYDTAKAHNAYIVTDSFACEMLYGKEVPSELREIQIYESEFLTALTDKGLYPAQQHGNKQPRTEKRDELSKSDRPFLTNINILGTLIETVDLSSVASLVPLLVLKSDVERLTDFNKGVSEQDGGVQWLKAIREKLNSYKDKGFLEFCPDAEQKNSVGELANSLFDCIVYSFNTGTPLWVDDRWTNALTGSGKAIIFGTYDFIHTIFNNKTVNEFEYQRMLGALIRNNVFFHVPPKDYVYMLLKTTTTEDNGELKETTSLSDIRRYVATALSSQSCIGKESREDIRAIPEIYGFILILSRLYCDLLERVWSEENKETHWKIAAGNWVWQYLSDFACDVDLPNRVDIENDIASKHMSLLTCLFRVNSAYQQDCSEWVFYKLYSYWLYHPLDKQKTANCIAMAIFGDVNLKETHFEREKFEQLMLIMCQRLFPLDFMGLVLENPLCKSKWGDKYETVQVDVEHIEYPMPVSNDELKYGPDCDFISLLSSNSTDWKNILDAVIHYGGDDGIDTVITFFNDYLGKHDADTIEKDCMKAVENLMLHSPVEYRVRLRELLRKF